MRQIVAHGNQRGFRRIQYGCGGVAGVAWATVLSQAVSALLCTVYMLRQYPRLRPSREAWRFDAGLIRDYLRIGLPICAQSGALSIGMFVITAVINSFGSDVVAAYTIGNKVEQLATVSFYNLAFSFSVYAGQNFGARRFERIKEGLRKGLCFLISDCYGEDGIGTALDNLRYRGQECAVIHTLSVFELDPALDGALKLTDSESGETLNLLADREALESYRAALEAFLKNVKEACFRRETPYALLDAGKDFEEEWIPLISGSGMI